MATINVLDANGNSVTIQQPLAPGRSAAATSRPVALSNEDYLALSTGTPDVFVAPVSVPAAVGSNYVATLGKGVATVAFQVTGLTGNGGVVSCLYSDDGGTTYLPLRFMGTATVPGATTITTDGAYTFAAGGHTQIKLQVATAPSQAFTVGSNASVAPRVLNLEGAGTAATNPLFATVSGTVTANLGTLNGAALAANQAPLATPGNPAPATGIQVLGIGPSGNSRTLYTGTNGGLLPGQAAPVSTRTVVTASTATTIDIARAGRLGYNLKVETSPTALVFVSYTGTASATNYDDIIPASAAAGTALTPLFGFTGAVSLFSTAAVTVMSTSWIAA